ncbi:unnamed protein product [Urochloa decumbens]|uniref:Uncharacterized protein n=1 Tax=Urochloa decumbens TaxID=240449 RepID=A0ABC8W0G4_9POAL
MACGVVMAREPAGSRVGGEVASSARTQLKRARDSLEGKTTTGGRGGSAAGVVSVVAHTPGQRRLQERMKAELDAVRALHRKAVLLCRGGAGAAPAAKGGARLSGAEPRREAAPTKRRRANPSEESATEAAAQQKKGQVKKQQAPAPRSAPPPSAKEDAQKKKREMEEMARAREEFRRLVLAMEKAALPDETVYRQELEELGIAPFEYAVTRTMSQALSQDRILVGVAY